MGAISKLKGIGKSLLSIEFAVLAVLIAGCVFLGGSYLGYWNGPDIVDQDMEVTENSDSSVSITIDSDHQSDAIVLRHPDNKDYLVWSQLLEPFGGDVTIPAEAVRCNDADFPDRKFEIALVSIESSGQTNQGIGQSELKTDDSISIELTEKFASGKCESSI
jgi:hypothetical protein